MDRKELKNILISLRTSENERIVNSLLGKIDLLTNQKISRFADMIGNDEEGIKRYIQLKIEKRQANNHEEHIPINEMFSYGLAGNCIHLHMPIDLHQMLSEKGISKTFDTVNLQLLDAIEKIRKLKNEGFYKFKDKDNLYMISPILQGKEIKFLNEMDFKTQIYKKQELNDEKLVNENREAQLAIKIFGKDNNVGTAIIGFDVINSDSWQKKKEAKCKELEEKVITSDLNKEKENN